MRKRATKLVVVGALTLTSFVSMTSVAFAQRRGPALHEPISDDPEDDRQLRVASDLSGYRQTSKGLVSETRTANDPADPHLLGFEQSFVPDRDTRAPEILAGANVFEPSISPYERVAAFDTVLPDFTLGVADASTHTLGKSIAPPQSDVFRARFEVPVARDRPTRVANVIAGSTLVDSIVTIDGRTVAHRIVADGAENWFLVASDAGRAVVRLTIAAPRAAFGGAFGSVEWSALPRIRELAEPQKRSAKEVLDRLGISRRESPAQVVERLTRYFREFRDSKDPPESRGDIYRDIALSKKGVCRHRAYAFLVTATALGLPTRLLMNAEHAWVEVHNGTLWKRIDLGGGGTIVNPTPSEVASYREPPDPFTWPQGSSSGRDTMRRRTNGTGGASGGPNGSLSTTGDASGSASAAPHPSEPPQKGPNESNGARSIITVTALKKDVLRGDALEVSGDVRAGERPCAFVGVDLTLVHPSGMSRSISLGAVSTDVKGHFAGSLKVPSSLALGDYRLVAKTRGGKDCGAGGSR